VTERDVIYTAYPPDRVSDERTEQLRATFAVGQERTPEQDLEFSIRRIVEIAQRALSPGINDPTTALYCIDRLGETMGRLAAREMPSAWRFDDTDRLRVVADVISLEELACPAFAAVARYGVGDADVVAHLLRALDALINQAQPEARARLESLAAEIRRRGHEQADLDFDRDQVRAAGREGAPETTFRFDRGKVRSPAT
jgi:uncharacterized membrane protein